MKNQLTLRFLNYPISTIFIIPFVFSIALLTGCATITTPPQQKINIKTETPKGQIIKGCQCELKNNKGEWQAVSPNMVSVQRSAGDLEIKCSKKGYRSGYIKTRSKASPAMMANMILPGGTIGSIIDHKKGTGYNYPKTIKVVLEKRG